MIFICTCIYIYIYLFECKVSNCAARIAERMTRDADARASGAIINTCGWIDGAGYELILHCIEAFQADIVLVMDSGIILITFWKGFSCNVSCDYRSPFFFAKYYTSRISNGCKVTKIRRCCQ